MGIEITGWGKCLPPTILKNEDFETYMDTSNEWIVSRTGVKERRISHVPMTELATVAAKHALASADKTAEEMDAIIVATCTPEYTIPSSASRVQENIGNTSAASFDINSACTGFVYGLTTAYGLISSNVMNRILLIGAEKVSYFLDWTQRDTAVLFGDAAGAVVIENVDGHSKLHAAKLGCDPAQGQALMLKNFGSNMKIHDLSIKEEANFFGLTFDGQEVFKHAVRTMAKLAKEALEEANLTMEDIELCIPHQANARILQATARRCDLPLEKVFINLDKYGNTSAASIPVALTEALEQNKIKQNSKILFLAFGAGLTSAAAIIDWGSRIQSIKKSRATLPACSKTGLELINQA